MENTNNINILDDGIITNLDKSSETFLRQELELNERLIKAQMKFETIIADTHVFYKSKMGASTNYRYAKIDQYLSAIRKHLNEQDIFLTQKVVDNILYTIVCYKNIQKILDKRIIKTINDISEQDLGKNHTYLRRYALATAFGLATEDNDANKDDATIKENNTTNNNNVIDLTKKPFFKNKIEQLKNNFNIENELNILTNKIKLIYTNNPQLKINNSIQYQLITQEHLNCKDNLNRDNLNKLINLVNQLEIDSKGNK